MQPLSKQLADLSVHAKHAEDALASAQKEAHDKVVARRDQTRAAATATIEKVDKQVKSIGDTAGQQWSSFQAKIAGDLNALKSALAQKRMERDVKRADSHAERLELQAAVAIDYANASIEQAELAVLDAIIGRMEADEVKKA